MQEDPGHQKIADRPATVAEIRLAIESLTEADMAKLHSFAKMSAFRIRSHAWAVGAGDLLQEAMVSLFGRGPEKLAA